MTAVDVAKLRELEKQATNGPWKYDSAGNGDDRKRGSIRAEAADEMPIERLYVTEWFGKQKHADGEFVAALRNAAPALLDAYEERRALRATCAGYQVAIEIFDAIRTDRDRYRAALESIIAARHIGDKCCECAEQITHTTLGK